MPEVDDHNGAGWLIVRQARGHWQRGRQPLGWFVVRICPCHWGQRVSIRFADRAAAERCRRVMLGVIQPGSA